MEPSLDGSAVLVEIAKVAHTGSNYTFFKFTSVRLLKKVISERGWVNYRNFGTRNFKLRAAHQGC